MNQRKDASEFEEHLGNGVLASDFEEQLGTIDKEHKIGWPDVKKGPHWAKYSLCSCLNQCVKSI